jgi:hypothetical protein
LGAAVNPVPSSTKSGFLPKGWPGWFHAGRNTGQLLKGLSLLIEKGDCQLEMHQLPTTQANVYDSQAGNGTPEKVVQKKTAEGREIEEEKIIFPVLGPGEHDQENPQFKAEKDKNQDQNFIDHQPGKLILPEL